MPEYRENGRTVSTMKSYAADTLTKLIQEDADFREGYKLHMSGHVEEALTFYRKSIARRPSAEAHTLYGEALHMLGDTDAALRQCREAIDLDPGFGNPWNDIGAFLMERGAFEEAEFYLLRATEAERYDTPHRPWLLLARVYVGLGRPSRAAYALQQAILHNPIDVNAREMLKELLASAQRAALAAPVTFDG